jgi:hypothetical protein
MKKKLLYFLLSSLLILNSCSSDIDNKSEPSVLLKTIKNVDLNDSSKSLISTIIYDGNKIVSIVNKTRKTVYDYDGNQIVKQVIYHLINGNEETYSEATYSYIDDKLHIVNLFEEGRKTKYIYTYNDNGTVEKEFYDTNDKTGKESKSDERKVLTVVNSNIVKSERNFGEDNDVTTTSRYDYDTNNNAFKNVLGFNLLLDYANFGYEKAYITSDNNLKRHVEFTIMGQDLISEPYADTMQYEYNKKGYPTKKTTYDYKGDVTEIIEYTY